MHNRDAGEVASSRYPVSVLLSLGGMIRLFGCWLCVCCGRRLLCIMKRVWRSFNGFSCAPPCLSLSTCSASQWPERRKNRRERADVSACSVHWLQFWLLYPSPFLNSASDGTVEELVRKVNSRFKNGLQTASEGWNTFIFCFSPFSCWIHTSYIFISICS